MKNFSILMLAMAFCIFTQEAKAQNKANPKSSWDHLDIGQVKMMDGFLRIDPQSTLHTKESFTGPIEIVVVARTKHDNIRLHAFNGSCVIFNWEVNRAELRVHRPDGNERQASGSIATAAVRPLDANTWYTLRWRVTKEGMEVFVNGRLVFSEKRTYNLWEKCPVMVRSWKRSIVDVKSFDVKSIQEKVEVAQKPKEEPGKTQDDKALLQGRWYAVYEESGGKALSNAEVVKLNKILDVSGDDFRIERPVSILAGKISLRPTDAPKRVTVHGFSTRAA